MEIQTDNPNKGYPFPCYSYDENNTIVLNTAYIMNCGSIDIKFILGVLNSCLGKFLVKLYVTQLQERQFRMLAQYVTKFPIVKPDRSLEGRMVELVSYMLIKNTHNIEEDINKLVYSCYHLTEEEINYLKHK